MYGMFYCMCTGQCSKWKFDANIQYVRGKFVYSHMLSFVCEEVEKKTDRRTINSTTRKKNRFDININSSIKKIRFFSKIFFFFCLPNSLRYLSHFLFPLVFLQSFSVVYFYHYSTSAIASHEIR